jgi:hypothetical protein
MTVAEGIAFPVLSLICPVIFAMVWAWMLMAEKRHNTAIRSSFCFMVFTLYSFQKRQQVNKGKL